MATKILPPPKGEEPLASLPEYGGRGGSQQAGAFYAGQAFVKQFGRNPSQSELTMLTSAYVGGDPNVANVTGGDSAVARYWQTLSNSPDNQKEDVQSKAPEHYDAVKETFRSTLGREPSKAELDHFATMMAGGDADAYSVAQGLQTLPEYTNAKDEEARTKLRGELQTADTSYLTQKVTPALQSQFAQQGRVADPGNPALAAAFANAAKQTNDQREQYLATVGHEDYTNSRQANINSYLQSLQRQYQVNDTALAQQNMITARQNDLSDYYTQQQAYSQYLQNYGRRKTGGSLFGGALQGGISGAGTGAAVGGPWGALIGGVAGAGLGAYGASRQQSQY